MHILVQFKISRQSDHNIPGTHTGSIQDQQTERPQHPRHILVQFKISRQSDHNIPGTYWCNSRSADRATTTSQAHILVQFKDYNSKLNVMRSRKRIRETMPHVFIHEDLTEFRATLLYKARQAKRERNIVDCWSFDGRIVIKTRTIRSTQSKTRMN